MGIHNLTMSLAHMLTGLLDQHGETVQQAALLAYLKQGEEAQPYLEGVLSARLMANLYKSISKEDKYEAARADRDVQGQDSNILIGNQFLLLITIAPIIDNLKYN